MSAGAVNHGVVARHAEDAAFLWSKRQRALRSNRLTHLERSAADERLGAHIDALIVAGDAGWQACWEQLALQRDAESTFAAMAVALAMPGRDELEQTLSLGGDQHFDALVSAIGWTDVRLVHARLEDWCCSSDPRRKALGIAGLACHRSSPGTSLGGALRHEERAVRSVAAKAANDLGERQHSDALRDLLLDGDEGPRFQAARGLARFGQTDATVRRVLEATCESRGPYAERAAASLVLGEAPEAAVRLFSGWAREPTTRRLALVAAETLGTRDVIEALVPWTLDDAIARGAGDTFGTLTGGDVRVCGLSRPRPGPVAGEPSDDPNDPTVELPPDYELPFPDASKVAAWWGRERDRFVAGVRYLDGKAVTAKSGGVGSDELRELRLIATTGRPRTQGLAALALAHMQPNAPSIETHAPALRGRAFPGSAP